MNSAGKTAAWMCVFSTLFMGCYSSAIIDPRATETKDVPVDRGVEVAFRLHNGTRIRSSDYRRVESGYRVVGTLIVGEGGNDPGYTRGMSTAFSGIVGDEQIKEIVTSTFSVESTIVAAVLGAGVVVGLVYALRAMGGMGGGGWSLGNVK